VGRIERPAFPAPFSGARRQESGKPRATACGEIAELCLNVIASAAKQSTFPLAAPSIASLRSQ
jgi:hypothetical protein